MSEVLFPMARILEILLGLNLIIQSIEYLSLVDDAGEQGVWSFAIQKSGLSFMWSWVSKLFEFLSIEQIYRVHIGLRICLSLYIIFFSATLSIILFLLLGTIQILIRWRGAFNGGSDFMTIVALTGAAIGAMGNGSDNSDLFWRAGLIYIAIHSASSYVISGGVKLLAPEWRSGRALPIFLNNGIFGPLRANSIFRSRPIAILYSWAFIIWEISVSLALFDPILMIFFCLIGIVFHLLVFWYFGLNRFFFAWITTFPALFYVSTQIILF